MTFAQSLFLGTALAVTALPVSVRILLDLNLLNSRLGRAIVSVALVNDLVAFAMLGLVVQFTSLGASTPEGLTIGLVALNNVLFVGLVFCVATILKLTTRLGRNSESYMQTFVSKLRGQEASFALCISTALGLGDRNHRRKPLLRPRRHDADYDTLHPAALEALTSPLQGRGHPAAGARTRRRRRNRVFQPPSQR